MTLNEYRRAVRACPQLSDVEQAQLAERIEAGDESALMALVHANLRYVVQVARKYDGRGLALHQLIDLGNIGLVRGAQRWREPRQGRFISFAVWWVRRAILLGLDGCLQPAVSLTTSVSLWDPRWWSGLLQDAQLAVHEEKRPVSTERILSSLERVTVAISRRLLGLTDDTITTFEQLGQHLGWSPAQIQHYRENAIRLIRQEMP